MRTTKAGLELIKGFESCQLTAYQDEVGRWTIGWGRARGIHEGQTCTQEQADLWFLEDVAEFEFELCSCLDATKLNDNQFSALVSFIYNVGLGEPGIKSGFEFLIQGGPSTLLKLLRVGDYTSAADEFPKWCHEGGRESRGLLRRRMEERLLFVTPVGGKNAL